MFLHLYRNDFVTLWPDNYLFGHKVTIMEKEIWKDIVGYEGLYQISSNGRVKRLSRWVSDTLGRKRLFDEKILVNRISSATGYPCINLSKKGKVKTWNIHTLIADAFIPNPYNLPCINHIDEKRANSVLSNIERCTYAYNNSFGTARDKRRDALRKYFEKNNIPMKFLEKDVFLSVIQYTLYGEIVGFFKGGYPEIKEKLGFGASVSSCLCHKNKSAYGFVWRYIGDEFSYSPRKTNVTDKVKNSVKSHQKYVVLLDDNGNELKRYKSVSEAAKENKFDRHYFLRAKETDGVVCVNGLRFMVEKKENEYIPKGHKGPRPDLLGIGAKAVSQYTKEGVFIKEYSSIKEAAIAIGVPNCTSEITNCCGGKLKSARGFVWAYKGNVPRIFINESIRAIEQYTIQGEYVATYNSIKEAAIAVGNGKTGSINNCLVGRSKSAFGFKWKYKNK